MMICGLPPFGAPLKRVTGAGSSIGAWSGKVTFALANPVPMIEEPQAFRATGGVVFSSFAGLQVARPLKLTLTWLSKIAVAVSIFGGGFESPEVMSRFTFAVTGPKPCFGSFDGLMLPLTAWVGGTPSATPATATAPTALNAATNTTMRRLRFLFIGSPLSCSTTPAWRRLNRPRAGGTRPDQ